MVGMACAIALHFSYAFPIVKINLQMNRTQAIAKAAEIADLHQIGPKNFSSALSLKQTQLSKHL
jgi:hypothetical protein